MKKIITFLFFIIIFSNKYYSQNVGINATGAVPNTSAMLDVASPSLGILIPRVSLTSTTDIVTIASPAVSLMVYNTNAAMAGGGVGYYWWNGTIWDAFNPDYNRIQVAFSTAGFTTTTSWNIIPGMSITATVPAGMLAKFKIHANVGVQSNPSLPSGTDVALFINGALTINGAYKRIYLASGGSASLNVFGDASFDTVESLGAGTYTFDLRCLRQLTSASYGSVGVGGTLGSVLQGTLIVEMILK